MTDLGIGNLLNLLTSDHTLFGGSIPAYVKEYARENGIACFDYMDMEDIIVKKIPLRPQKAPLPKPFG